MPVSTIKLASGHDMPLVGFGLWKVPAEQAAETVYNVGLVKFYNLSYPVVDTAKGNQGRVPHVRWCLRLSE